MPAQSFYTIGVDVGTGSARACLVDWKGELIGTASRTTQTFRSQIRCYEQSTSDIWNSICTSVKQVLAETDIDPSAVASIVFTATCSLAVFSAKDDAPVSVAGPAFTIDDHNVILWMHHAATYEAELINQTKHEAIQYLGGTISPFMALSKVLWLKNNLRSDVFENSVLFDLHDALAFMATGNHTVKSSKTFGSTLNGAEFGVDGEIKGWSPDLLVQIGLDHLKHDDYRRVGGVDKKGRRPLVGTPIGNLCEKAAKDLGLGTHVMVGTGTIDCYAGWVGTAGTPLTQDSVTQPLTIPFYQRLALVAGTSACHILASDKAQFVPGLWGPYQDFLLPRHFVVAGGQPAVGRLLEHIISTHPAHQEALSLANASSLNIFDYLNQHLEQMKDTTKAANTTYLARHIFFYGDHFGNRAPIADAGMTGTVIGQTGDTSLDDLAIMYYATLEFLALQTRHIITSMTRGGHQQIRAMFMSGSLCLNPLFVKLLATACDMPVVIPQHPQTAVCYGAALIAAYTARLSSSAKHHNTKSTDPSIANDSGNQDDENNGLWSVMTQMTSKPGTFIMPEDDQYQKTLLNVKYTIFLRLADEQRLFRKMIDDISIPTSIPASV